MKPADMNFVMPFGKHKGKTLGELVDTESKYVMWLIDNQVLSQGVTNDVFEAAYIVDNDLENPESKFYKNENFPDYK